MYKSAPPYDLCGHRGIVDELLDSGHMRVRVLDENGGIRAIGVTEGIPLTMSGHRVLLEAVHCAFQDRECESQRL